MPTELHDFVGILNMRDFSASGDPAGQALFAVLPVSHAVQAVLHRLLISQKIFYFFKQITFFSKQAIRTSDFIAPLNPYNHIYKNFSVVS